jgi:hypothetical protein
MQASVVEGHFFRWRGFRGGRLSLATPVVTVALPGGGLIRARGSAAIGLQVFVRGDVIEGVAPSLILEIIEF